MSDGYEIKGPELEGEHSTITVATAPAPCPLCGQAPEVGSSEYGFQAWCYIQCRCGLTIKGGRFPIQQHCGGDELRRHHETLIAKWNTRANPANPADPVAQFFSAHRALRDQNPYSYAEIAYTRVTEWMAWLCSNAKEIDPNRKILACGQGATAQEACESALRDQVKRASQSS